MEDGYYWAKYNNEPPPVWEVVEVGSGLVHRCGCELVYSTSDSFTFGWRIESPPE
jgi:hypothetical protein